ncbi:uncharacterized [Tachysurus ichikawai]
MLRPCRSPAPCPPSVSPATNGAAGRAPAIKESRKNTEEQRYATQPAGEQSPGHISMINDLLKGRAALYTIVFYLCCSAQQHLVGVT